MGSDNSKVAPTHEAKKKDEGEAIEDLQEIPVIEQVQLPFTDKFSYGPPPGQQPPVRIPIQTVNNAQPVRPQPPPPYSTFDPLPNHQLSALNAVKPVAQNPSQPKQIAPQPKQVVPQPAPRAVRKVSVCCDLCFSLEHETLQCGFFENPDGDYTKAPPPIPTTPKPSVNNQYKWTKEQAFQASLPLEVKTNANNQKQPTPNQTPSPGYDPGHNPYVWKNSQPSPPPDLPQKPMRKFIDLNQELPKIQAAIKGKTLPSYQHFNKELSKNKPLAEARKSMVNSKYMSDVTFMLGGSVIHGHKMFLITASFLFYEHFHTKGETEMLIESIDHETFQKVLTYCYTDKIDVTPDNVLELMLAANQLQVRQITNMCHSVISKLMSPESVFIIFEKAIDMNNELFKKKSLDFISKNEDKCFESKGFFEVKLPSLMKILDLCNYPSHKQNLIIEKYMNGMMTLLDDATVETPQKVMQKLPGVNQKLPEGNQKPPGNIQKPPGTNQKPPGVNQKPPGVNQKPPGANQKPPGANQKAPDAAKQPGNQKPTGAVKKQVNPPNASKKKQPQKPNIQQHPMSPIPDLMSLLVPKINTGLFPFPFPPPEIPQQFPFKIEPVRPFANSPSIPVEKLINFDDDDDDRESIISKDDESGSKVKVNVIGSRQPWVTEFSRIDLVCKRSMLLHKVFFNENLATRCKEVRVTISVFEQDKRTDVHNRKITINPGMKLLFIQFNREPLKLYIGQKFCIKMNFTDSVQRINNSADALGPNDFLELQRHSDGKKYFNCVAALVASEMQ